MQNLDQQINSQQNTECLKQQFYTRAAGDAGDI